MVIVAGMVDSVAVIVGEFKLISLIIANIMTLREKAELGQVLAGMSAFRTTEYVWLD